MIRILIDNEEVVCKNNIKIDEKMLSTSSVILNNCYPKSWEDDKDYVSRFYFPKDYSKCKIIDYNEINFEILGSSIQNGTPTPSTPSQIISKTGVITETIDGKEYSFNLGEIELNKIGNYTDRIFKSNNKWYLEKNTRKLDLEINSMDNDENYPGWNNQTQLKADWPSVNSQYLYNLGFKYLSNISIQPSSGYDSIGVNTNYLGVLFLNKNYFGNEYTQTYWQTNFEDFVFSIIYNLQTPEITEITDTNLLNDLYSVGEDLIFCGLVKNTGKISLNPRDPHYVDLQILDFKALLSEGETFSFVINNKTIIEAITQVIENISDYGFVLGEVNIKNPDDIINAYSTLNKTAYDVFQYIADITQSKWSTKVIDEKTISINFNDPTIQSVIKTLDYTQEYFDENNIDDMSFSYSTNDYRNKQIITSNEVYGSIIQRETKIADGYSKNFVCDNKIGQISSITTNGEPSTFATKSEIELGTTADYVYQPGESNFLSTNNLSAGDIIIISYYPIVKGREIVINNDEINRINNQTDRKGIISRYENRNDTTSSQELIKIGQSYIKYKGNAEITLKVIAEKDLFEKGEVIEFNSPLEELSVNYLVKNKTIDIYPTSNKTFYTYEMSSNFNSEDAINYFDNQRAKNQGNIGEGETITRNIDLESSSLIKFYDTNIEEIEVLTVTSLDFSLDSVII